MARIVVRCAAVLCALVAAAMWAGPHVVRADLYSGDAAQHTFWLYRYADPSLLPHDPAAAYFALPSSAPWGYRGLYALLAPRVDVLTAAEWLAPLLFLASCALAWSIGRRVAATGYEELGGLAGVAAVGWLVAQYADAMTPLALQRTFALPITLLFLWAAIARRWAWIGASWLLAALIYPVVIVVLGLAGVLVLALELRDRRRLPSATVWNGLAGCAALAIVIASAAIPPDVGPTVGREALAMPEFGLDGRLRLHGHTFSGTWLRNQLLGVGWSAASLLAIAAAVAATFIRPRVARIPRAAWVLLGTGVATWTAAHLTLFALYLPNRHVRWAIAAFAVVAVAAGGTAVLAAVARRWRGESAPSLPIAAAAVAGALAVVVASFAPGTVRAWSAPSNADLERAYEYIARLPRSTLVAAHPDVADFVPLRAHRSVLASTETSLPFMQGYYRAQVPRLEASLRAAYATSWAELDAVLEPWGADVVLTAPRAWSRETYYAPFDRLVAELRARGERDGFVLRQPDPNRVLFRSGDVYVVRVIAPRTRADAPSAATASAAMPDAPAGATP